MGDWLVCPELNCLRNSEGKIHVKPQVMRVFTALIERAGQTVSKDELIERVWEKAFVSDEVVSQAIYDLRRALGDDARQPRYIQTIPKTGYRLIAPLLPASGTRRDAWLRLLSGWPVAALLLLLAALFLSSSLWRPSRGDSAPEGIHSLAVLPFEDLSRNSEQGYLAEGITDSLISKLTRIHDLKVIPRDSVVRYRSSQTPSAEIARQLGVDALVRGTVQAWDHEVRISAYLTAPDRKGNLWAQEYERRLGDLLELQNELAVSIAREVTLTLTEAEKSRLQELATPSAEAYQAQLMGRYLINRLTREGVATSRQHFQKAIRLDPRYADAWQGLAYYYFLAGTTWGTTSPRENLERARQAARKALELDPSQAAAHGVLALIEASHLNFAGAEREFLRSLELNPSSSKVLSCYSSFLLALGRTREAARQMRLARKLDPLSIPVNSYYGRMLLYQGRTREAVEQLKRTIELEPNLPLPYRWLEEAYLLLGEEKKALGAFLERRRLLGGEDPAPYRQVFARSGMRGVFRYRLEQARSQIERGLVPPMRAARILARAGEGAQAVRWLERAYRQGYGYEVLWVRVAPAFASLRALPSFQALVQRIGFPEEAPQQVARR